MEEEKPPFVDNIYLLVSALDPLFSYGWIEIDIEIEHDKALTSGARNDTKRKIEELIAKEKEALTRRDVNVSEREPTSSSNEGDIKNRDQDGGISAAKIPKLL